MELTRYSLFGQKIQLERGTERPLHRAIAGESLLDHFLGDERLYLAQNNDFITQSEIDSNALDGTELLLVDRDDLIYGSPEAKAKLTAVLPIDYLAGAYASVFKGGCERVKFDRPLKVAVVDFSDYNSGNANIPVEVSRQFVHDSCGAIDAKLLQAATGKENAIQFRLGLTGERPTFAKGMLNPIDLQSLFPSGEAPDAIVSTDSFKGNKVAPGWYEYAPADLFLGIKNDSLRTDSSIAEVVSIYPESAADVLPIVHSKAQILAANSQDIVTQAAHALNDYYLDINEEGKQAQQDEFNTAKLIEMALTSGRYNLLNSAQVQDWLVDRINASWKNLACADIPELNSYNSTVLPAWDLKYGEVCVPYLKDGEELTFWRSPIVNRNGIVTVRNNLQVWENLQKLGADPNIIYVNVQTLDRIQSEDPATYARLLEEYGSKERLHSEFQTLMQTTQMDFDGDTANVIERVRLPELYAAVHLNQHPDFKLANFHKSEKNLPVDWTLAQIAEHIRPNYVGVVYSHKKAIDLSRAEISVAIARDDHAAIAALDTEYFHKAVKLLDKSNLDNLVGRSIVQIDTIEAVKLPPEVRAAALAFVNSYPERELLERDPKLGYEFVADKMLRFRNNLSFLVEYKSPTQTDYYEFVTPQGERERKLPAKLIRAIEEFQKLPLRSLKNHSERLDEYLGKYERLCELLHQAIDLSQPIAIARQDKSFNRQTNKFETYRETTERYLTHTAGTVTAQCDRLRLYQKVLDAGITATSQLNQDAVDVFKSANIVRDAQSQALARELARDKFPTLSGRARANAFRNGNLLQPNGIAVPHLIQEICNQNYIEPFRSREEISNPDLIRSFQDIAVSPAAAAIARFYLSDDRQIIEKYRELKRIEGINGGRKTYLEYQLGQDRLKVFNLNPQVFREFKRGTSPIRFDFKDGLVTVDANILGKLDPSASEFWRELYPDGLCVEPDEFERERERGNIDLIAIHDDRRALGAERRAALQRLRDTFTAAAIPKLEALAAIAQATNRARAGFLIAAYPETLKEHIKAIPVDNLILDDRAELAEVGSRLAGAEVDFEVDRQGNLNIGGERLSFLADRPLENKYQIDNRIKAASQLKSGTIGRGKLVTESYLYSLSLTNKQGVVVTNLTAAGKQIVGSSRELVDSIALKPIVSLPYTIEVMGMQCPIANASEGLTDLWAGLAAGTAVTFGEFRYNPIDPRTGKASFAAMVEDGGGKQYYLEGAIPDLDRQGIEIRERFPDCFVKTDFTRSVSPAPAVVLGYDLVRNTGDGAVKLGKVTVASARGAGILHDYTWDIVANTQAAPPTIPQPKSLNVKTQIRLEVPEPEKMFGSQVWEIAAADKVYRTKSKEWVERARISMLNDYSSNPLLVTMERVPTIAPKRVELRECYRIAAPAKDLAAITQLLDGGGERPSISYRLYTVDTEPHPDFHNEYQRGYSILRIDAAAVVKSPRAKTDPVIARISKLLATKQVMDRQTYERELGAGRIVRPLVGKNLQDLGSWLHNAGKPTEIPQIEIDKLQSLPSGIAPVGIEAKSRFHARVGMTPDRQHAVFYFGVKYLRDRFVTNMGDAPLAVDLGANVRSGKVYAAIVPIEDLQSYMREHYRHYSYNYDGQGRALNKILSVYGTRALDTLPPRATTDVAMGFVANKYVGKSLLGEASRVEQYAQAYGENANVARYDASDTVMVTGNRFNGTTFTRAILAPLFEREYLPLLQTASDAGATIVFGNGNGVDGLVRKYLEGSGYRVLEHPHGYNEAVPQERARQRLDELTAAPAPGDKPDGETKIPVIFDSQVEDRSSSRSRGLVA